LASYYENRILEVLEKSKDGLTTIGIAEKANISKTTTLKYLASLRAAGMIDYIEVGPAKLWRVTSRQEPLAGGLPESKEKRVRSILKEFKEIAGVLGSVVVDNDGLTISADLPWNKRPERIGSLISRLLQLGERSAKAVKINPLKEMILEGDNGRIIVRNEGDVLLIAISGKEASLGLVKIEIEEFAKRIKELIR
jgi:predicted regulator of Ras-like GTPase activity (Roadblock/LC7/MglB family)